MKKTKVMIVYSDELRHYGIPGMRWKNHIYAQKPVSNGNRSRNALRDAAANYQNAKTNERLAKKAYSKSYNKTVNRSLTSSFTKNGRAEQKKRYTQAAKDAKNAESAHAARKQAKAALKQALKQYKKETSLKTRMLDSAADMGAGAGLIGMAAKKKGYGTKATKVVINKSDSSVTKKVKNDHNTMTDKEFKAKYKTSKSTYQKRVNKYGDPYKNSPLVKTAKAINKATRKRG